MARQREFKTNAILVHNEIYTYLEFTKKFDSLGQKKERTNRI